NTTGVSASVFTVNGAAAAMASPMTVQGNYIGTNATGTAPIANSGTGVQANVPNVTVIGNLISGNGTGIGASAALSGNTVLATGSSLVVQGNSIGTNAARTAAIPNSTGLSINAAGALIGGTALAERNVIAGNTGVGLLLSA